MFLLSITTHLIMNYFTNYICHVDKITFDELHVYGNKQ